MGGHESCPLAFGTGPSKPGVDMKPKIISLSVVSLLLLSSVLFVFGADTSEGIVDASQQKTEFIGRGINLLTADIEDLDNSMISKGSTILDQSAIDDLIIIYDTMYEKKEENYTTSITEHMTSIGGTVGFGASVKAGFGPYYASVGEKVEVGLDVKDIEVHSYAYQYKMWTVRTSAVTLSTVDDDVLSTLLSAQFEAKIKQLDKKLEEGTISDNDYAGLFNIFGTHVDLGHYVGGQTTTTATYVSDSTTKELETFVRNTVTGTVGTGMPDVAFVEVTGEQSVEKRESVATTNTNVVRTVTTVTKGGNVSADGKGEERDLAWADSVKQGGSQAVISFIDGHVMPIWQILPDKYSSLSMAIERYFYSVMNDNYLDFCKKYGALSYQNDTLNVGVYETYQIGGYEALVPKSIVKPEVENDNLVRYSGKMVAGHSGYVGTDIFTSGVTGTHLDYNIISGSNNLVNERIEADGTFVLKNNASGTVQFTVSIELNGKPIQSAPVVITIMNKGGYDFVAGNGTEDNPFLIYTYDDLNVDLRSLCSENNHYKLMSDITCPSGTKWIPIGDQGSGAHIRFKGHLDGNGFAIKDMTIDRNPHMDANNGWSGMFCMLGEGAEIKNLTLSNFNLSYRTDCNEGNVNIGGFAGGVDNNTSVSITNCSIDGSMYVSSGKTHLRSNMGGIVGFASGSVSISQCSVNMSISSLCRENRVGGIGGRIYNTTITNCVSNSDIYSEGFCQIDINWPDGVAYAGSIVGTCESGTTINNCVANGTVKDEVITYFMAYKRTSERGAIAGYNGGSISNCYYKCTKDGSSIGVCSSGPNRNNCVSCYSVSSWSNLYSSILDRSIWKIDNSSLPSLYRFEGIESTTLDSLHTQSQYVEGDHFNPMNIKTGSDMTIHANYSSQRTVVPDCILTSPVFDGKFEVCHSRASPYGNYSTMRLNAPYVPDSVKSIEITKLPNKLAYNMDEVFSPEGIELKSIYISGRIQTVNDDQYDIDVNLTYSDPEGNEVIVTLKGTGLRCVFYLSVKEPEIVSNTVTLTVPDSSIPVQLFYETGGELKQYLRPFETDNKVVLDYDKQDVPSYVRFDKWIVNGVVQNKKVIEFTPEGPVSVVLITKMREEGMTTYKDGSIGYSTVSDELKFAETTNMVIRSSDFNSLPDGKTLNISITSVDGDSYVWSFANKNNEIKNDILLNIEASDVSSTSNADSFSNRFGSETYGLLLDFAMSGDLPNNTSVTVDASGFNNGDEVYVYLKSGNDWVITTMGAVTNGKVKIPLAHCSQYVVTTKDTSLKECTVRILSNNGEEGYQSISFTHSDMKENGYVTIPEQLSISYPGHSLKRINTESNESGKSYALGSKIAVDELYSLVDENNTVTLYAIWSEDSSGSSGPCSFIIWALIPAGIGSVVLPIITRRL